MPSTRDWCNSRDCTVTVSTQRTREHLIRTIIEMSTCTNNYSTLFFVFLDAKNGKGIHIGQIQKDFEATARHVRTRNHLSRHFGRSGTSEKANGVSAPLARTAENATAMIKAIARAAESARVRLNMQNSAQFHHVL